MAKRSRRRRPKRTARGETTQLDQRLSRRARELLDERVAAAPAATEESEDGHSSYEPDVLDDGELDRLLAPERLGRLADREALERLPEGPRREGRVVGLWSGGARIETAEGELVDCVLSSRLAREQAAALAAGDRATFVAIEATSGPDEVRIHYRLAEVLPRHSALTRLDPLNPRLERVIAANVDRAVVVASLKRPPLRPGLIDRYLLVIERGGARPILCVNKLDLVSDDEREEALEPLAPFRELGLPLVLCSAVTGEGIETLRRLLAEPLDGDAARGDGPPIAVVVGHSGVGKSSLLNALAPEHAAAVGHVDRKFGKGRHTTTGSALYRLQGFALIDTPGIRELGIGDLTPAELRLSFADLAELALGCRFADCSHAHEPACAVLRAVEAGTLSAARYGSYRRILDSLG